MCAPEHMCVCVHVRTHTCVSLARYKPEEVSRVQVIKVLKGHTEELGIYSNITQQPLKNFSPRSNIINKKAFCLHCGKEVGGAAEDRQAQTISLQYFGGGSNSVTWSQ